MELYKGMAGSPITYLINDITAGQTNIAVADDSALPDAPNICTIGYGEQLETIKYGAKSNGVLQEVTRGIEGTPRAWQSGTEVARFFTAYDHNNIIKCLTEDIEVGTLELKNGWTGTLEYRKNGLGQVYLSGDITAGELGNAVEIATLPIGVRPNRVFMDTVALWDSPYSILSGLLILGTGIINIRNPAMSEIEGKRIRINCIFQA